jgi:4-hydroxy-3-polyprenylbenzoate decarboxylase
MSIRSFTLPASRIAKIPIYAATIVGKPPMEDAWMGKAVERIFLPMMKMTIPEIVDINLPAEGVFHNLMLVSIRKSYPGRRGR